MKVKTRIVLDLNRPGVETVVYAKQWDKLSRYIEVSLYAGSAAFTPPTGATYEVRGVKPDNTVLKYSKDEAGAAAVTVSGHTATITLAQQALACPGDVKMELGIKSGAEILTSFRFILRVEQSALADITSNNYVNPALATFIPSVSSEGVISWTNDGGLANPTPRNIRGPSGAKIISTVKIGEDTDGGYKYRQTFDDGQTAEFTAPRGPAGTGNVSSVAGIEPDSDGNVPLTVGADLIEAGAVGTAQLADRAVTGAKIAAGAVSGRYAVTIPSAAASWARWNGSANNAWYMDITVSGVKSTDRGDLFLRRGISSDATPSLAAFEQDAENFAHIVAANITTDNTLRVFADEIPANNIYCYLRVVTK